MKVRNVKAVIGPEGNAISSDDMFYIEIEDDGGGEYVSICQPPDYHKLLINPHEWPALKKLVDKMVRECLAQGASDGQKRISADCERVRRVQARIPHDCNLFLCGRFYQARPAYRAAALAVDRGE